MLKLLSNLKIISKVSSLLLGFCTLSLLSSCVYQQPDESQYVKPYQQQSVPVQTPRVDGYYYNPPQYPGYGNPQQPASRYYNNPYAMPPQNASPYYDQDQYYTPPSAYGASDNVPSSTNYR